MNQRVIEKMMNRNDLAIITAENLVNEFYSRGPQHRTKSILKQMIVEAIVSSQDSKEAAE